MRVAIDLQGCQSESRFRGIGRYTREIVKALIRNGSDHEFVLFANGQLPDVSQEFSRECLDPALNVSFCTWHAPGPVSARNKFHQLKREIAERIRTHALRRIRADVVYIPSLFEGFIDDSVVTVDRNPDSAPTVVTLYDLIPLLQPESYLHSHPDFSGFYYARLDDLKAATRLLAISQSAANEAMEALGFDVQRIINVSSACDQGFFDQLPQKAASSEDAFKIGTDFILYSGAADPRKNLSRLIKAFSTLPDNVRQRHKLVLAGRMNETEIEELKLCIKAAGHISNQVVLTGYVSDEVLLGLYRQCKVFVLPSLHEGFGLPALEAMSCGAAVIGSNCTSIPEVIGLQEALFDPLEIDSIVSILQRSLTDDAFHQRLVMNAECQAQKFSWDLTAQRTLTVLEQAVQSTAIIQPDAQDWAAIQAWRHKIDHLLFADLATCEGFINQDPSTKPLCHQLAACIERNEQETDRFTRSGQPLPQSMTWRIEGPFDSSYSLALLNRELALALQARGHRVILHSKEGPGDYDPDPEFLVRHPAIRNLYVGSHSLPQGEADATSRNLYPPHVHDMACRLNLLHTYGWEESGFPLDWARDFNQSLQGITVVSAHVKKILMDHGVHVPIHVSGDGTDHWLSIKPNGEYKITARGFRFLHVSSCFPRKGIDRLLEAYGMEFSADDDVSLVIKTFANAHNRIHELIEKARQGREDYPDIVVLEDDLADSDMQALYAQCDVLVAPSRAEGFGLPLAEAMLSGLAVITTGWSGQMDFCDGSNSWLVNYHFERARSHFQIFSSIWADPCPKHLSQVMREVYALPQEDRDAKTFRGRESLLRSHKWSDVAERVELHARAVAVQGGLSEPRIGWISSWNTRCGIAGYSQHLVRYMPGRVTVFAPRVDDQLMADSEAVHRCWTMAEDENLEELSLSIESAQITTLVIQFNYGFFDFDHLANLIERQKIRGLQVVIMMHATSDPPHAPSRTLARLAPALRLCDRVLVHTPADLNCLKDLDLVANVSLFPHGVVEPLTELLESRRDRSAHRTNHKRETVLASYGFFLPHKGLIELIKAVGLLSSRGLDLHLRMVNAQYPGPASEGLIQEAKTLVRNLGLSNRVTIISDYLSDDDCLAQLLQSDLIVFPYQGTQESSSAAVRYGLATGVPVAVSPIPIFDDVQGAVLTLPGTDVEAIADGIETSLREMRDDSPHFRAIQEGSLRWRQQHSYSALGERLHGLLRALSR